MSVSNFFEQQLDCRERPLTVRRTNLRKEFVKNGRALNITQAISEFTGYRRDKDGWMHEYDEGSKEAAHSSNKPYADKKYAKAMGAADVLQDELSNPYTVVITLRGDRTNANGEARAYVDHLHDLYESNSYVTQWFRDNLGEFGRLSALCAEDTGHAFIRHALWVDGPIARKDVQPAVDTHLEHCAIARESNHITNTIDIRMVTEENRRSEKTVEMLAKDIIGFDDCIGSPKPEKRLKYRRFGAMLLASGKNQWNPDRTGLFRDAMVEGTQEYKENNPEQIGEYHGIRFRDGGDVYDPSDFAGSGGSPMVEVTEVDPSADPV